MFERLLASTALGLVLVLSSQAGMAQTASPTTEQQKVDGAIPVPDTTLPPPLTAKDVETPAVQSAPLPAATTETAKPEAPKAAEAPVAAPAEAPKAAEAPAPATPKAAEAPKMEPTTVADSAVSDRLREVITSKQFERSISRKAERAAVEKFYTERNFEPLWVAKGAASPRATSALDYIAKADAIGLEPADYNTPDFAAASSPEALADAELKLTAAALTLARHAQVGRVHFTRVSADISFEQVAPEPADILSKLAASNDAAAALDAYNPPMPEFKALRAKLAELRKNNGMPVAAPAEKKADHTRVPEGKIVRLGMKDERVPALRKRLDVEGDKSSTVYDEKVRDAVKAFQTEADLKDDGNLGNVTIRALNGDKKEEPKLAANPTDLILVNMERWRWYPRDLGNPHVIVNIPDYSLTLWNNGNVYWNTRIVVGKPNKATPLISAEMKFITVNPTWNVPPSIIEHEYLPALREDPQALDRIGLKVQQNPDGTVRIYQPPGAANALGRIRFNFPNKFLVYQHDTPDKHLFARDERAYSHGCMRVQNPFTYGEKLLSLALPNENYSQARIEKMLGSNEINVNFPKPIWVHLTYQTAFVDADGKLQLRKDVYGRDSRMLAIMKGSERKVADIAIDRPPNTSARPVKLPPGSLGGPTYTGNSGPNFFDWLFSGGRQQPEMRPRASVGNRVSTR